MMNTLAWIMGRGGISFPNMNLEMDPPVGFSIGSASIRFYGVIIAFGLLLAVVYGLRRRKQFGLKEDDILDGVLGIVPFAIICARLYYVAFQWADFKENPISILYIWEGGLAIYGGVIGAALGVVVFCRIKKIKLGAVLDLVALGFLIGQCVGRWGNFFNREAFGAYTDGFFAMRVPATNLLDANSSQQMVDAVNLLRDEAVAGGYVGFFQVHPTFLYESVWNFVGFIALHFLSKKRQYDGQIALGYVAWYGLGRTVIEGLRMDSLYWGTLRVSQVLAAATCFVAVAVLLINFMRKHDRANLYVNLVAATEGNPNTPVDVPEETTGEVAGEATEETAEEATEETTEETPEETTEEIPEEKEETAENAEEEK